MKARRKPTKPKRTKAHSKAHWDRERERAAKTSREKSRAGRDIAPLPAIVNPQRRERGAKSLEAFCRIYFPEVFVLPWSNDHRLAIERIETAVRSGGLFAFALPRGSGKTSLAESAVLWAALYGYRQFPVVIGSEETGALELLDSVKSELERNELLLQDFPEACYPIRRLEGIAHRANGQLLDGKRTHITWTAKELVLPSIAGSVASAAAIAVAGITGRIRGMKFKRPDGRSVRPDFVLIDDPQTKESAKSPQQVEDRLSIIRGDILGLAGPGKKIAAVLPCTVICPEDLSDQILDRRKHPEWQGVRTKLIYKWPDELDGLWQQYKKIRSDGILAADGGKAGTEFYRANREAMDRGAEVAWASRFNPDELSAVQHAMNLRYDLGDEAFFSEHQNEPLDPHEEKDDTLTADVIAAKTNGRERAEIPDECTRLVAFVDVQKPALYWGVAAFEDDFTGYVIDYGVFPEQARSYFAMRDIKRTLSVILRTTSLEETIYAGLSSLTADLLGREWTRDDGATMKIERLLIDANWGESTDVIYKFARESAHAAQVTPSHGKYVGATSVPFNEYRRKKGDRVGDHWRMPNVQGRRSVRYVVFDSNHWKTFVLERLRVPLGGVGCLSLFGAEAHQHRMFAEHQVAEQAIRVEAKGRVVIEHKLLPARPDNHFKDVLSGCCVAASIQGAALAQTGLTVKREVQRVRLSDLQKKRRVWRANR